MKQRSTLLFFICLFAYSFQMHGQSPTMAPFNFSVNFVGTSGTNIGWTNGNGTGRMVIVRPAQPVSIDISTFDATGNFSNNYNDTSTIFAADHKRIYQGSNASVSINNLQPGTVYHVAIYEYNQWPTPSFNPNPLRGFFTTLPASGLAIGGFLPFTFCSGETFSLPFVYSGAFDPGNTITAQISDANGNFATPLNMGTLSTVNGSGAVPCQIPQGLLAGNNYRFRILSSSPIDTSIAYPISIEIINFSKPSISSLPGTTSCASPVSLQTDTGFTYLWYVNGFPIPNSDTAAFQADSTGYYQVEISSTSVSCSSISDSILIEIFSLPELTFNLPTTACIGDSILSLAATPAGGVFSGVGVQGTTLLLDSIGLGGHTITYTYTDTLTGCTDSLVRNIQVVSQPTLSFSLPDTIEITSPSLGLVALPSGGLFTGPGVSNDTLTPFSAGLGSHFITYAVTDTNGCSASDSVVIHVVAPAQSITAPLLDTLCTAEDSLLLPGTGVWNGLGVTTNVFYLDSVSGAGLYWLTYTEELVPGYFESDSTQLVVVSNPSDTQNYTLCFGDSIQLYGQTFSGNSTQTIQISNSSGCDSIIVITTSELIEISDSITATICSGDSLFIDNQFLSISGNYTFVNTAGNGCDSTTYLTLQVQQLPVTNIMLTLCLGDSILIGNNFYSQTGTFQEIISRTNNCDSLVNLTLTIDTTSQIATQLVDTICAGDIYTLGNQQLVQTGIYTDTLTNSNGCDSTVVLDLFVLPSYRDTTTTTICAGDSVLFGGTYFQNTGVFTITNATTVGCDSLLTLDLTVTPRPQRPVIIRNHLLPGLEVIPANGDSYEWYLNGVLLPNDTTASIENASGGMYTVIMYQNGCPSLVSIEVSYSGLSTAHHPSATAVKIAPNPAATAINILGLSDQTQEIQLLDLSGRLVSVHRTTMQETYTLNVSHMARGSYTLQLIWLDGTTSRHRIVIQ